MQTLNINAVECDLVLRALRKAGPAGPKHREHWMTAEDPVQVAAMRLMQMNAVARGIVTGALAGLAIFVATNWLLLKGGTVVGPHLALLGQFFPGYTVTFAGSFIGLGYGFVLGFAVGYAFARIYNWFVGRKGSRPAV